MSSAKLQMLDLCSVVALAPDFPADLSPRIIHVLVTRDADDLDEVQRTFKALDFSTASQTYVPSLCVAGKKDVETWRKSARFAFLTYERTQGIEYVFTAVSQVLALNDSAFPDRFPYPPVVVGPNIWSNRSCSEIDMRGVRFSDEELLVGRKLIASLLKNRTQLMSQLPDSWDRCITAPDAPITPYPRLWFQALHFAIGLTLFSASSALLDYLELTRSVDASRLRLRSDRKSRYTKAIDKLKSATSEAPWVYGSKPLTKDDALALLEAERDAFVHHKDGQPVLAFTEASLIRCAELEQGELDDFIAELKANHLLTNKTHPVSFLNGEQKRFICVNADAITVTGSNRTGDAV